MPGTERFPRHRLQTRPLISEPGMHHGTCVTHGPWCMSGSLTRGRGENVPGIPGTCANRNFTYPTRIPYHSGPTEKVQALHRSLNMANAAIGKRFLWSIVRFCGVTFTLEADILQVWDVYEGYVSLICHIVHTILSIIPEIVWAKSTVLTILKYQQRTVQFTNKRMYNS